MLEPAVPGLSGRGVPGRELDAVLLGVVLQRGVGADELVVRAGVTEHQVAPGRPGDRLDLAVALDRGRHRGAELHLQFGGHVDDVVADEGRPGRGHAVPGQPAEQRRERGVRGGREARHRHRHPDAGVRLLGAVFDPRLIAVRGLRHVGLRCDAG